MSDPKSSQIKFTNTDILFIAEGEKKNIEIFFLKTKISDQFPIIVNPFLILSQTKIFKSLK